MVRVQSVWDERHVNVVVQPRAVIKKHHLAEQVMGVEGVYRDSDATRLFIAFFIVIIVIVSQVDILSHTVNRHRIDKYIYGVVFYEAVLDTLEKAILGGADIDKQKAG